MIDTITIPMQEYKDLQRDSAFLLALEDAGVDNWEGYDIACETFQLMGNDD
jgi:hypothetical protein